MSTALVITVVAMPLAAVAAGIIAWLCVLTGMTGASAQGVGSLVFAACCAAVPVLIVHAEAHAICGAPAPNWSRRAARERRSRAPVTPGAAALVTGRPRRPGRVDIRALGRGMLILLAVGAICAPIAGLVVYALSDVFHDWIGVADRLRPAATAWLTLAVAASLPALIVMNDADSLFRIRRRGVRTPHLPPATAGRLSHFMRGRGAPRGAHAPL